MGYTPDVADRGRPPLPDEERRDNRINLRLTDAELELIEQAAQNDEQTPTEWVRSKAVAAAKRKNQ